MINPIELVLLARDGLTELPESIVFSRENLLGLIPQAITVWQDRTAISPEKRHSFLIQSDPINVMSGKADLTDVIDEFGYRLEFIHSSDIVFTGGDLPKKKVVFVNSWDRLAFPGRQDKFNILAYIEGKTIQFRSPVYGIDENPLTVLNSRFRLNSPAIPDSLENIPKSVESELALIVAELAKGQFSQQNRALNIDP